MLDNVDEAPNDPSVTVLPKANPGSFSVDLLPGISASVSGGLTSRVKDGRTPTYTIVSEPILGDISLTDVSTGAFIYSTSSVVAGADSFTFTVNDGVADSIAKKISIELKADPLYRYQLSLIHISEPTRRS